METITVEVVYALPDKLFRYTCQVAVGTTLLETVKQSGLLIDCPELDIVSMPMGIFGKKISRPAEHVVEDNDRIELYRPVTADPKLIRKLRARKNAR